MSKCRLCKKPIRKSSKPGRPQLAHRGCKLKEKHIQMYGIGVKCTICGKNVARWSKRGRIPRTHIRCRK